ncbi:MAG: PKD domain-containing protein, partial [Flavobacteriales bacterium]|nr:PKD domain-containing protein [Flavobacteriales bacterium]
VHTYLDTGTYTVCLIANNACNSDTSCMSVNISICLTPVASFSYSDTLVDVQFTDLSQNSTFWYWDFGDGMSNTIQNPLHTYSANGIYTVCQTVTNSCGSDTICQTVQVTCTAPAAGYSFTSSSSDVTFTSSATNNTSTFWDFGDGMSDTVQNPLHTYSANGTYTVCQTATNSCGSDTICQNVQIVVTGIEPGIGSPIVTVSPNPSSGMVLIEFGNWDNSTCLVEVRNIIGVQVYAEQISTMQGSDNYSLNLQHLPKGVYFLQFISGDLKQAQKLVIE